MAEPISEQRDETRFDHISPLQVKDLESGAIYEARMQNYSNGGIYFESDGLFQKDTKLYFCMQNSPYIESTGIIEYYSAEVKWRKNLKRSSFDYGYGVQLVSTLTKQDLHSKMVKPYPEYRVDNRFNHISPLQVKNLSSGEVYEAKMLNYSNGGIYCAGAFFLY